MELLIAATWIGPLAFLWLMARRPSDRSVAAFAKTYSVPLTSHNVDQLRRYIQWTRRWRLGGVVATTALATVVVIVTRSDGTSWIPLVAGYSLGSLLGELARPAERVPGTHPAASLEPRLVRHFVVTRFVVAVIVVFVASLLPAAFLLIDNPQRPWIDDVDPITQAINRPQDWFVIALTLASVGAAAMAWIGARALARAPMPGDTRDRMAVRHAIRSAAMMSLIGGTVMISGLVGSKLGAIAAMLDGDAPTVIQWMNGLVTFGCFISAWWGGLLTLTTIPRFAPFTRDLPAVPPPDAARGA